MLHCNWYQKWDYHYNFVSMFAIPQKVHFSLDVVYEGHTAYSDVTTSMQYLRIRPEVVLNNNDVTAKLDGALEWLKLKSDEFTDKSSGWHIRNVRNPIHMAHGSARFAKR